jgi:hypothetical protein
MDLWDERTAFQACLWCLAFPTAFYSGLIYTESLFLFLALAFFYFSRKGLWFPAFSSAFFLSLSRPTGILVVVASLMGREKGPRAKGMFSRKALMVLAFSLGLSLYLFLMGLWTGDCFSGFSAQRFFVSHNQFTNFLKPWNWFTENFIQNPYTWNGPQTSFLNRAALVGVIVLLPFLHRRLGKDLFVYVLVVGVGPALLSDMMSYIRYASILFPIFIWAALGIKNGILQKIILSCFFLAQACLLIAHSLNYWVG